MRYLSACSGIEVATVAWHPLGWTPVAFAEIEPFPLRRLTPRECERLQGFPDDYTLIPYRGKPAADGPRYKALGNSMAVPVMAWIGQRIALVSAVAAELDQQEQSA